MTNSKYQEITFSDADIVNLDDWIPAGEFNPHNKRPWLIHDHGFTVCIVFADCEQDALDEAVDQNKLDSFLIDEADYADYAMDTDSPTCSFLGNASEPFDIEALSIVELPNPPRSFCSQFNEILKS